MEYRVAEEYGYAFNFLVSYGDNVNTKIIITANNILDTALHFYTVGKQGGEFKVVADNFMEIIDTTTSSNSFIEVKPFADLEKRIELLGYVMSFIFASIATIILLAIFSKYVSIADKFTESKRLQGIDVIRLIAVCFVIMVHALFPAGYYESTMIGTPMFLLTYFRSFLICCVPLFMTLIGYLNLHKNLEKRYYKKLIWVLLSYIIICILYELYRIITGNQVTVRDVIDEIFLFQHAWYVGMYIGIFLLTPFLNIIWRGLDSRKNRIVLLFILILITSLHSVTNNYIAYYWQVIYPITYYFAGCFLATYSIRMNKAMNVFLMLLLAALQAVNIYFSCWKGLFDWATFGGYQCSYNALPTVLMVILFFSLLDGIEIRVVRIKKLLQKISGVSLEIYLLSVMITDECLISVLPDSAALPERYFLWIVPYTIVDVAVCFILALEVSALVKKLKLYLT